MSKMLKVENLTDILEFKKENHMANQTTQIKPKTNVQPVPMDLKDDAGKRVILNTAKRIMKTHAKEIKALADK